MPASKCSFQRGFTLIELVIGIMVFAVALGLFSSMLVPLASRSVDPVFQVRASELAQSLINEIVSKPFDEQSSRVGGFNRCNELGKRCTAAAALGPDGSEMRDNYNDVDDYDGLEQQGDEIQNVFAEQITYAGQALYAGFSVRVQVYYDDNMDGIDDALRRGTNYIGNNKLVSVAVTTPNGETLLFSSYRSNY